MASKNGDTGSSSSETASDFAVEKDEQFCDPNERIRELNKGFERKKLAKMKMVTCNWEHFLLPAPTSIAILGELICIATKKDFSLKNRPPNYGFVHIKHPDSFRACLMQVSNTGCAAFIFAHKNMDKIELYSAQFQESIKQCVFILTRPVPDSEKCKQIFGEMKTDAASCLRFAEETEKKFDEVILLIDEITESSAAVKGVYQDGLKDTLAQKEVCKSRQKELADRKKEVANSKIEIIEQVEKAKESFVKSLENIPGPGKMFLMNCGESLVEGLAGLLKNLAKFSLVSFNTKSECRHGSRLNDQTMAFDSSQKEPLTKAYEHVSAIRKSTDKLYELFEETGKTTESSKYTVCLERKESQIMFEKAQLERIKSEYENCSYIRHPKVAAAIKLTLECIAVIKELTEMPKYMQSNSFDHLFDKVTNLRHEACGMEIKANAFYGVSSFTNPTKVHHDKSDTQQKKKRAAEIATENARYKVEERKSELIALREEQRRVGDEMKPIQEKQDNVLEFLSKQEIEKTNFEEIQIILGEGLRALAELKGQWSLMALFFSKVTEIIDICIHHNIFRIGNRLQDSECMIADVTRDMVLDMASEMDATTNALRLIAETYTTISEKHFIPKTAALGRLIAFDPETDGKYLEKEQQKLKQDCIEAKKEITRLADESRQKAVLAIDGDYDRLSSDVEKRLPPVSKERLAIIK